MTRWHAEKYCQGAPASRKRIDVRALPLRLFPLLENCTMKIVSVDHFVLTVRDVGRTIKFYQEVLGMKHFIFDEGCHALHFGTQKINLHPYRNEYEPHADITLPGSADFCFISDTRMEDIVEALARSGVEIEDGPCLQQGARGKMQSVYFRDPDGNLVEVAVYE
jgi:catechol 2,3-dioxygenase-like lactoylglutathione lyase family enzyme